LGEHAHALAQCVLIVVGKQLAHERVQVHPGLGHRHLLHRLQTPVRMCGGLLFGQELPVHPKTEPLNASQRRRTTGGGRKHPAIPLDIRAAELKIQHQLQDLEPQGNLHHVQGH
jgi:hypothetical protein